MPAGFVLCVPASCCVAEFFDIMVSEYRFTRSFTDQNANQISIRDANGLFRLTEDRTPNGYVEEILAHWTIPNDQVIAGFATSSIVDGEIYGQINAPQMLQSVGKALGPHLRLTLIENEWGVLLRLEDLIEKWKSDSRFEWRKSHFTDVSVVAFLDEN